MITTPEDERLRTVDILLHETAMQSLRRNGSGGAAIVMRPGGLVVGVGFDTTDRVAEATALENARSWAHGATLYTNRVSSEGTSTTPEALREAFDLPNLDVVVRLGSNTVAAVSAG